MWAPPLDLLRQELTQRSDEGCRVPERLRAEIISLETEDSWNVERLNPLYDELMSLTEDPELSRREPNDLEEIRRLRPHGPRDLGYAPSRSEALDRFHGAWTGRAVGCALGKPVEGMGMTLEGNRCVGRAHIKRYLQNRGDWPLADYFSGRDVGDEMRVGCRQSQREHIAYMEPDDDIHYTLVGLGVLEERGADFGWHDVAKYWISHIPVSAICTAERQAVLNLFSASCVGGTPETRFFSATPQYTRRHWNPYREWIGAQIRADGWAWCCAGKPELAAEFAYRDACWTHERNGIYGEMMFAALQAAAFVERDPARLIEVGLSEIPAESRLAQRVRECLRWQAECPSFEGCMDRLDEVLGGMSPVHTINNALICCLSLLYGRMDTTLAITTSVMCGHDTDCNGATVGSIVGAARGRRDFGGELAPRLNDTIRASMIGFQNITLSELAERTLIEFDRVNEYFKRRAS
ncbi:MAG TPA: ADP-ribosylglycohydrolase family protein [Polyangiaceae bacterium]|jgi:hypothetical protein